MVLTIEASNASRATGMIEIYQSDGWWEGDTFYWQAENDLQITDPDTGEIIGTFLSSAALTSYVVPDGTRSNPQVNLGFAMSAGDEPTTFTVQSALLTLDPQYVNPDGKADAAISVTDFGGNGDGAELIGQGPNGGAFLAEYNGFVPGGTTFDEGIESIVADAWGTETGESHSGWLPINDTVVDMSTQISFTLTPGDSASGTSSFQVVPEPTGLLLLLAGLGLVRRR